MKEDAKSLGVTDEVIEEDVTTELDDGLGYSLPEDEGVDAEEDATRCSGGRRIKGFSICEE